MVSNGNNEIGARGSRLKPRRASIFVNTNNEKKWWKEAVVYQIYPASFMDTNGDGWGDVRGITSKLDYLKELGVDVIWTSPIYKSPMADMGYDISDYMDVGTQYGTLADVDNLISELQKRHMKLMIDLVVNHTSNEHPWFLESRSSLANSKREWYIWKKPRFDCLGNRLPPNNWAQILGEANSAWTYDEVTEEYYLSLFTPEQPDLNWENPEVREAVHTVLRFWLDRGVSGFRMDVINLISKVQSYPDAEVSLPAHEYHSGHNFFANGPRLHEYLMEIRDTVLDKYDTITVGEMPFVRCENELIKMVGADAGPLNMLFTFDLTDIDQEPGNFRLTIHPWDARDLKRIINKLQRLMFDRKGWNSVFCENHDQPRSISRFTDDSDENREIGAKLLCLMQTTLSGTLYIYQGEEIGMRNVPEEWSIEEYKDVESINYWQKMRTKHANDAEKLAEARHILHCKARDHSRTPMQWDSSPHGGFCKESTKPWMRVNDDYVTVNVQTQIDQGREGKMPVLSFWKDAVKYRAKHKEAMIYGDFELLEDGSKEVVAYRRFSHEEKYMDNESWLIVLNFSGKEVDYQISDLAKLRKWDIGNYDTASLNHGVEGVIKLRPWEGLIGKCAA